MSELDAFDYELPASSIAQRPLAERSASRLLVDRRGGVEHRLTGDLPELLGPGDVLVLNSSRVVPARLALRRPTGGKAEVLLLEPRSPDRLIWEALVRPSRKIRPGTVLTGELGAAVAVGDELGDGRREVCLQVIGEVDAALDRWGQMPLPPYIDGTIDDPERYQTVYADRPGSAAAPTAGLHLTGDVLDRCRARGARIAHVELHIGLDTFRPLAVDRLDEHQMHSERYSVSPESWAAIEQADRVVAVGTTVVRTLEAVAATGVLEGRTDIFIRRPFEFGVVDALMTNFHLPRSTLLVLLDAFVGPRWSDLYEIALAEGYRLLSFGDAMFVERRR